MGFFNSVSIWLPLAAIGGILYGLLTYYIVILLSLPYKFALFSAVIVSLFYLSSRLLIFFSGIDTPYYSREERSTSKQSHKDTFFYQTAQWVGKFYHYHDVVLFTFLVIIAMVFLVSLVIDEIENKPFGRAIQDFWNVLTPLS